jgi:integrase
VHVSGFDGRVKRIPVRRKPVSGNWYFRKSVRLPDGRRERICGVPGTFGLPNTKVGAQEGERRAIERLLSKGQPGSARREVYTFRDWFLGRFWREWVIGHRNKPSEVESKQSIFKIHLDPFLGELRLDEIGHACIAQLRASLVEKKLTDKRINNILAVLSKALRYAEEAEVLEKPPRVRLFRVEQPEIETWTFDEYGNILEAARTVEPDWYLATLLAGDAGLRIGEIRALEWDRDVDLVGKTITVSAQMRHNVTGTPKGRTRRTMPMTDRLHVALRTSPTIRHGYVVRNLDGSARRDPQTSHAIYRLCRAARPRLPERGWHVLRHTFGTHAALFGANPWVLMDWMGHKRIDETMLYVHFAGAHARPTPHEVLAAGVSEPDPNRRIIAMLSARGTSVAPEATESRNSGEF